METVIIDYGSGNVQSIRFALERLGFSSRLSKDKTEIKAADKVIFPGVGHSNSAMEMLKKHGLDTVVLQLKQPVMGICLGMQLMCRFSEEGNTPGLGIFDVDVKRFSSRVKVPQMGWNTISELNSPIFEGISDNEYVYMVHSFYAEECKEIAASTTYDLPYAAALQKNNFHGVQFHPEKSGETGEKILLNFLNIK